MKNKFTRRNFIQTAAGAAGLALATKPSPCLKPPTLKNGLPVPTARS